MVHTVGIVGVKGNVGAPTAQRLAKTAGEGKINLVIFHREGSKTDGLPTGKNVELKVLNFDDPAEKIEAAIKGINVFISAVGFGALPTEPKVVAALAKSPDLVTYVPSCYSTTWDEKDDKDAQLGPVLAFLHSGWNKAIELGIGVTPLYIGIFENYWFEYGFLGAPLKENTVWANEKQLKNRVPITALDHVAEALTHIATSDPQTVKNKSFSAVTFWPTGQELIDLYTKLNGKQAQTKPWTVADRTALNADGANFGPAKVGYWDRWENGTYAYESENKIVVPRTEGGLSMEEYARQFV